MILRKVMNQIILNLLKYNALIRMVIFLKKKVAMMQEMKIMTILKEEERMAVMSQIFLFH